MQNSTRSLIYFLRHAGIRPASFVFFLLMFMKRKPQKGKSKLSKLLTLQLKAQAELIVYYLNR